MSFLPWGLLLVVLGIYAVAVLLLAIAGRRTDARALAAFVPDCAVLVKRLVTDPETTTAQRVVLVALAAYLVSPIDFVPDFIPVAGQLDDAILVALALGWLLRTHGEATIRSAWPGPEPSLAVVVRAATRGRATGCGDYA